MGYRNDVTITVANKDLSGLVNRFKSGNDDTYDLIKNAKFFQTDKFTTLYFESIKWDEDTMSIIYDFGEDAPCVFKLIGEDYADIECHEMNVTDDDMRKCVFLVRRLDIDDAGELINILL